jgi:hypothetical protein
MDRYKIMNRPDEIYNLNETEIMWNGLKYEKTESVVLTSEQKHLFTWRVEDTPDGETIYNTKYLPFTLGESKVMSIDNFFNIKPDTPRHHLLMIYGDLEQGSYECKNNSEDVDGVYNMNYYANFNMCYEMLQYMISQLCYGYKIDDYHYVTIFFLIARVEWIKVI